MSSLAALFANPAFLAGGALVAVPILIHLINRRRFREVDWAAMEFLLVADKKNRRRVKLESLILLLLRCLAMILIAVLLARPRAWTDAGLALIGQGEIERVVLLDDSASMRVRVGNGTLFDAAKAQLARLVEQLARERRSNRLTVLTTARADRPVIRSEAIRDETVDDLIERITALSPSEGSADMAGALIDVERTLRAETTRPTRVIYVVTDLRDVDWDVSAATALRPDDPHPLATLRRLDDLATATFLVGVEDGPIGGDPTSPGVGNVGLVQIQPDGPVLAGVSSAFDVTVENFGTDDLREATVELTVGETIPVRRTIERLGAGRRAVVRFEPTFARDPRAEPTVPGVVRVADPVREETLAAEVIVSQAEADRLPDDDTRVYATRVLRGVPVLLVDGDPSARFGDSETFYLRRALMPPGTIASGLTVDTVTETEFESTDLSRYEVVFLCDVAALPEGRLDELAAWVRGGGGLVIAPGGRTDVRSFNDRFGAAGARLAAAALTARDGDETSATWSGFELIDQTHPALRIFTGENNPFLRNVKVFRWWRMEPEAFAAPAETAGATDGGGPLVGPPTIRARLSSVTNDPAMVDRAFGRGRVFQFAFPLDAEWTNWPTDPSFLIAMQELARSLARGGAARETIDVGATVRLPLDPTQYRPDATLTRPDGTTTSVAARPAAAAPGPGTPAADPTPGGATAIPGAGDPAANWEIVLDGIDRRGVYTLTLTTIDEQTETRKLAVNIPAREGDLAPADRAATDRALAGSRAARIGLAALADASVRSESSEWWKETLVILVGVLGVEQSLAWWFGRRRRLT